MTEIEMLRNALGIIQSLYNFLHGSTKRHALFKDIEVHEEDVALTLKSLSTTRWSCRWAAVRAVLEQVPRIMEALYLQGEQTNIITAKKTADAVVKTLSNCRNEESFTQMSSHADVIAQKNQNRNRGYEIYLGRRQGASNQTITPTSGPYWRDTCCSERQLTTDGKRPLSYYSLVHKY
ncbi:unnamed protein product [Pocillopora meandrina]|uniref:Uncharacterized protein n=1 Tax=Pocillopora meandrina TaxID=46732 RepID=A0AAU9XAQ4_9CNID|nr:unnamed protein product [Pocillopora meandrina]